MCAPHARLQAAIAPSSAVKQRDASGRRTETDFKCPQAAQPHGLGYRLPRKRSPSRGGLGSAKSSHAPAMLLPACSRRQPELPHKDAALPPSAQKPRRSLCKSPRAGQTQSHAGACTAGVQPGSPSRANTPRPSRFSSPLAHSRVNTLCPTTRKHPHQHTHMVAACPPALHLASHSTSSFCTRPPAESYTCSELRLREPSSELLGLSYAPREP